MKNCESRIPSFRKRHTYRYINGTKGAISLLLAILMIPFVSTAGALISSARFNSAIAVFDEALCNASNSTLGTYDKFLKERFGLLAMSQNTAAGGSAYSVEQLISDTFVYYVNENLNVLSNTFIDAEATAAGVYPLSDPGVLTMEVMEASKYTVPVKLTVDGFSIDDIIGQLTKGTKLISSIIGFCDAGVSIANALDEAQEGLDDLKTQLETCMKKTTEYNTAYTNFASAVTAYNEKVAEMEEKLKECEQKIAEAEKELEGAKAKLDEAEEDETEKDTVKAAEEKLEQAKQALVDTRNNYLKTILPPLLANIGTKRDAYTTKIEELMVQVEESGDKTKAAQDKLLAVKKQGVELVTSTVDVAVNSANEYIGHELEDLESKKKDAEKKKDSKAVAEYDKQIAAYKEKHEKSDDKAETGWGNAGALSDAVGAGVKEGMSASERFIATPYKERFQRLYSQLADLNASTKGYTIPKEAGNTVQEAGGYFFSVTLPLKKEDVDKLEENMASEVTGSSIFGLLKALIAFAKALLNIDVFYNPELIANISGEVYSGQGGLPSVRQRSLTSVYQESDSEKSREYKKLLGSYYNKAFSDGSVDNAESAVSDMKKEIDNVSGLTDNLGPVKILFSLGKIIKGILDFADKIIKYVESFIEVLLNGIEDKSFYRKLLLTGYIGYNTANRTTYSGEALTGGNYNLPALGEDNGYVFNGAETEYIIKGSMSEKDNQTAVFWRVYLTRLVLNLIYLSINPEFKAIVQAATLATAPFGGFGGVLVTLLYVALEPFADAIILVNGGDIPWIKQTIYLTPSGLPELIGGIITLGLTEAKQKELTDGALNTVNKANKTVSEKVPDRDGKSASYKELKLEDINPKKPEAGKFGKAVKDGFSVDYTQTLIFFMLLMNSNDLIKRLGDVIQMEAAYDSKHNGIATYGFDLDKSYTYLRASGKFQSNVFISLSDKTELNSTERVIYRGY